MLAGRPFLKLFRPRVWPSSFTLPRFQAHRGSTLAGAPENSLASLREAAARGARMAEFDVRFSCDGVPMLAHDETLARVQGREGFVHRLPAAELRAAGVDTLAEVLGAAGMPELLNIEVKSTRLAWRDPGAQERRLVETIRRAGAVERVSISSFDPMVLFSLGQLAPELPLAYLYGHTSESRALSQLVLLPLLKVHMLNLDRNLLDERWLGELAERGIPYCVWTVNDRREADFFLERGAKSIITDRDFFAPEAP